MIMHGPFASKLGRYALGRLPVGTLNKTEQQYSDFLEKRKISGEILWFKFEALKLRLADKTFYTPDFMVMAADEVVECHEVKGFMQDDAAVKIKVAAATYPFRFFLCRVRPKKDGGGWNLREYGGE